MTERFAELLRCAANARRAGLDVLADHLALAAEYNRFGRSGHSERTGQLTPAGRQALDEARARRRRAVLTQAVGGVA